jgi:hypothetical protein
MVNSIHEKEDQDKYNSVKNLDNIAKNVVTPDTECGQEDEERSHREKKFLQQYKCLISEKYAYMWTAVLESYGYKANDLFPT